MQKSRSENIFKILISIMSFVYSIQLNAISTSSDMNYIVTYSPRVAATTLAGMPDTLSSPVVRYHDGLGRLIQTVAVSATLENNTPKELVSLIEYDALGREHKKWLPAVENGQGTYITKESIINSLQSSYSGESKPYSLKEYEASPLNIVIKEYGPGQNWQNNAKGLGMDYFTNNSSDSLKIRQYTVNSSNNQLIVGPYFPSGRLFVSKKTDEDGHSSWEFTDKNGRVLLSRTCSSPNVYLSTYYVYDNLNRLRYVLPPLASDAMDGCANASQSISNTDLNNYAYFYRYDDRGNCIEKKIPGAEPIYFVYDKADRLVLFQDGNQRSKATGTSPKYLWSFNKYDIFGRNVMTGIVNFSSATDHISLMQMYKDLIVTESYNGTSACIGYTKNFIQGTYSYNVVLFYDNYSFKNATLTPGRTSELSFHVYGTLDACYTNSLKGLQTGRIDFRIDNQACRKYTAYYYDSKNRIVKQSSTNFFNCMSNWTFGFDIYTYKYDFNGNVLHRNHLHNGVYMGSNYTEGTLYTYDFSGRLKKTQHYYGNEAAKKTISTCNYNNLGQLVSKNYGDLETQNYSYNIRGWLTSMNGALFSENIYYDKKSDNSTGFFNGNISQISNTNLEGNIIHSPGWRMRNVGDMWGYNQLNFTYSYDNLNRMTSAVEGSSANSYREQLSYDKHGNVLSITRKGILEHAWASNGFTPQHRMGVIDQLTFGPYQGNQILNVSDASAEDQLFTGSQDFKDNQDGNNDYAYDANGNMVRDLNKNISTIRYNSLNLPDTIQMRNGHYAAFNRDGTGDIIRVLHRTCTGSNVSIPLGSTVVTSPSGYTLASTASTEYYDNFVYDTERVRRFFIDDGIMINMAPPTTPTATPDFQYHFYLKDHLGNIRVVFHKAKGTGTPDSLLVVDQVNNYYPFGMEFGESAQDETSKTYQNHLFSGKEFDNKFQMNTYNFGARELNVDLPIWRTIDPLAEKYYNISPYAYCHNNPVNRIDPDGMADYFGINGKYFGNDRAKNDDVRVISQDNWNKMRTVDKGIIIYNTDYKTNQSVAFSQAQGMTDVATLEVYQHYNPTDLSLRANPKENGNGGGAFWFKKDGSAKGLEMNIQGNKSLRVSDHSNEIVNIFVHEKQHYDDFKAIGVKAYINLSNDQKEQRAISASMIHETFTKMRPFIQELKKEYGIKHGLFNPISPINPLKKGI